MARENTVRSHEYDEYDEANVRSGPVTRDFETTKSLSSKATDFNRKKEAVNDAQYRDDEAANDTPYEVAPETTAPGGMREAIRRSARRQAALQNQLKLAGAAKKVRKLAGITRLSSVTGAAASYFFQLLAGLATLVALGGHGSVSYFLNETIAGKIVNATVGYFVDLNTLIPFEILAMAFWAIGTVIAFGTFVVYLLFFFFTSRITGVRLFNSTMDYLLAGATFAFCVLPVGHLFPAVLLWVIYVTLSSINPLATKGGTMGGV